MALDAGSAYVTILPDVKGFASNLTKGVQGPLAKASADLSAAFKANLTPLSVAAIGTGAAIVAGFGHAIGTTIDLAGEVRKLSVQLGISAEDASKLRAAGADLGVSTDKLSIGFGIFEKHLVDGGAAFTKYGITLNNTDGTQKGFNEVLAEAADKYKQLGPGIEGSAFAMDVFGRSGKDLIPILNQGADGLARLGAEAEAAGLVLSGKDVEAARNLAIEQRKLGEAFKGLEVSLAVGLLPAITALTEGLTKAVQFLQAIPTPVKDAAAAFIVLVGAVKAFNLIAILARGAVTTLGGALVTTTAATEGAEAAAVGLTAAYSSAVAPLTAFVGGIIIANHLADQQMQLLNRDIGIVDQYGASTKEGAAATEDFGQRMKSNFGRLSGFSAGAATLRDNMHDAASKTHDAAANVTDFGTAASDAARVVPGLAGVTQTLAGAGNDVAAAFKAAVGWVKALEAAAVAAAGGHAGATPNIPAGVKAGAGRGTTRRYAGGGLIDEPVQGIGLRTGQMYTFAENGPETVVPPGGIKGGAAATGIPSGPIVVKVMIDRREIGRAVVAEELWRR